MSISAPNRATNGGLAATFRAFPRASLSRPRTSFASRAVC